MKKLIRNKNVILLCYIFLTYLSVTAINKVQAISPRVKSIAQDILEQIADEKQLRCPQGTILDIEESSETRVVCDVTSDPNPDNATDLDVYPMPAEKAHIVHEDDLPALVNKNYPDWYRGNGEGSLADRDSHHVYYTLLGPGAPAPGYDTENLFCSSFYLKPGKTYIAHNHPAREFYYVISGQAKWYAGKETFDARPGHLIVHPPYLSHGFTNTSTTEDLRAFGCWWQTSEDGLDSLNFGGLPTNPCLVDEESTATGYAVDDVCPLEN
jgi:mannose-6-phosphate isomerase-like protein (cupin superfamily)